MAGFFRQFLFALENGVRQSDAAISAHADDADAAAAQWCGDGSNDVVQKICRCSIDKSPFFSVCRKRRPQGISPSAAFFCKIYASAFSILSALSCLSPRSIFLESLG